MASILGAHGTNPWQQHRRLSVHLAMQLQERHDGVRHWLPHMVFCNLLLGREVPMRHTGAFVSVGDCQKPHTRSVGELTCCIVPVHVHMTLLLACCHLQAIHLFGIVVLWRQRLIVRDQTQLCPPPCPLLHHTGVRTCAGYCSAAIREGLRLVVPPAWDSFLACSARHPFCTQTHPVVVVLCMVGLMRMARELKVW